MLLKSWLGRFWPRFGWSAVVDVGQLGEIRPNLNKWEELWQLARSNIKQIEQTNKQMNDKLPMKNATGNKTIRGIMDFWVVISFNLLTKTFVSVHQIRTSNTEIWQKCIWSCLFEAFISPLSTFPQKSTSISGLWLKHPHQSLIGEMWFSVSLLGLKPPLAQVIFATKPYLYWVEQTLPL